MKTLTDKKLNNHCVEDLSLKAYKSNTLGSKLDSATEKAEIVTTRIMNAYFPLDTLWSLRWVRDSELRNKLACKLKELRSQRILLNKELIK